MTNSTTRRETVVGVFHSPERARDAIEALKEQGFAADDIGVLMHDREQAGDVARETGVHSHAGEGAATGAVAGGILGGLGGWLAGIGALAIPGIGPLVAAGAFTAALGGAAIGAGVGAIAGALVGMGVPKDEAEYYEGEVRGGRTLVTVKAPARYDEAQQILRDHDAYDVETRDRATAPGIDDSATRERSRGDYATSGLAGSTTPVDDASTTGRTTAETTRRTRELTPTETASTGLAASTQPPTDRDERTTTTRGSSADFDSTRADVGERAAERDTMALREEQLQARKQSVEAGQVSLGKDVVEERRSVDVPVKREEVFIDRHPVDRPAADQPIDDSGKTIDVPVRQEQVEVSKQPVVYEEVGVGKREVTEQQKVSDSVRREEARIDTEGDLGERKP
jgi:uncharacterized protein (TIGR02271 family)